MAFQSFLAHPEAIADLWDRDHSQKPFESSNYRHVQYAVTKWLEWKHPGLAGFWDGTTFFDPDDNTSYYRIVAFS